jgi:hypothetical protein
VLGGLGVTFAVTVAVKVTTGVGAGFAGALLSKAVLPSFPPTTTNSSRTKKVATNLRGEKTGHAQMCRSAAARPRFDLTIVICSGSVLAAG